MMPRRSLAALLALYTAIVVSGAPLPVTWIAFLSPPTATQGEDQRYPCEACLCGCSSATHCWTRCCCHTLEQRLAWARREGVRPPDAALDQAESVGLDVSAWRQAAHAAIDQLTEGTADQPPPCCRPAASSCCKKSSSGRGGDRSQRRPAPAKPGVSLVQALSCQGLFEAWLALGDAPIVTPYEWSPEAALEPAAPRRRLVCHSADDPPDAPPPEPRAAVSA